MTAMFAIRDLVYRYETHDGGAPALDRINLTVHQGEYVAIIGPNGSGKSTLAKHLNALLIPDDGQVLVAGMDTRDAGKIWDIRQRVGMVFQNPDNQIVAAVVEEDVAFGPENLNLPPAQIKKRVEEALTIVDMWEYRQHAPHLLSGGQKQRVAIAGVIAMRPACIVLDEPTAMLDPRGRAEVMATVKKLNQSEGITVVLITHFMDEAVQADRVVVMDAGKIVMDGPPRQIFAEVEALHRLGLDAPDVTQLAHHLRRAGLAVPPDILSVEEMVVALCP